MLFDSTPLSVLLESLDAAKASDTGVRVFPMMDNMPKKGPTFLVELWKNEALRKHPSLLRVGERPVVITFGTHGAEVWRKRLADARTVGGSYFVIGDVSQPLWTQRHYGWPLTPGLLDAVRAANEPVQGIYCFADWSPPQMRLLAPAGRRRRSPSCATANRSPAAGYMCRCIACGRESPRGLSSRARQATRIRVRVASTGCPPVVPPIRRG